MQAQINPREWRAAFVSVSNSDTEKMKTAASAQGIDASRINWQQPPHLVAADVMAYVTARMPQRSAAILAALIGART